MSGSLRISVVPENLTVLIRLLLGNYSFATNLIQKTACFECTFKSDTPYLWLQRSKKFQNLIFYERHELYTVFIFAKTNRFTLNFTRR